MAAAADPLHRSRDDRMLAGVAAGAAQPASTAVPSSLYAERAAWRNARRARRREAIDSGRAGLVIGAVLIAIGGRFPLPHYLPWFDFQVWWPIGIVTLGPLLVVVSALPHRPSG